MLLILSILLLGLGFWFSVVLLPFLIRHIENKERDPIMVALYMVAVSMVLVLSPLSFFESGRIRGQSEAEDTHRGTPVKDIEVGREYEIIAISEGDDLVYVILSFNDEVLLFEVKSDRLPEEVEVGGILILTKDGNLISIAS